ncbi:MAG: AmmeMemoRadiSam system protein B [Gemmataceae bacterium]|nr:AmmeMemoRadiSam system protein B [Gemmataceae bacterium]
MNPGQRLVHPQTMELAAELRPALLDAVGRMVRDTVYGEPVTPLPAEAANLVVSGTFTSLKRGTHLRACCGGLQTHATTLGAVLADAVHRTVMDDPRFPPISPSELPYLDVELWLLYNPQRVQAKGRDRAAAVITGGKHGVVISWGEHRGLLLPGVAAEHEWDSETFLDHVCLKAGLHPSRWQDDDTLLITFEGVALRGPVAAGEAPPPLRFLSPEQLAGYRELCRHNLAAMLFGGTPIYSPPDLPDGSISGLVLTLPTGAGDGPWQVSRIDPRRGMALHASLFQLTQALAQVVGQTGIAEADLNRVSVAILYDPALHGNASDADLRGLEPRDRAVLLIERAQSSLVYDARGTPEALVREAVEQLCVKETKAATVYSLAADVAEARLVHTVRVRPRNGQVVRPPAVAGTFYPADPKALTSLVDDLLGPTRPAQTWPAAMVPHAGLKYSGKIAAAVWKRLAIPSTVIIIGPKHTPHGVDWAVAPHETWSIPGAQLGSDLELARRLSAVIAGLELDAAAHAQEHGIEVELPFLARLAPHARVVGITIGAARLDDCRRFADGLAQVIAELPEPPLLVISSDMNHFASDAATRRLDELALQCLDRLDPEALHATCRSQHITMCGLNPAIIVLETLRRLGRLGRAERVGYATTADTTGDKRRVVGYAGMLFGN